MVDVHLVHAYYFQKMDLLECLRTLKDSHRDSPVTFAITIVDNTKNADGIVEALQEHHPDAVVLDAGGNVGCGRGNNLGFNRVDSRYVMSMNADLSWELTPRALEKFIAYMEEHPEAAAAGPLLRYRDGERQDSAFSFALPAIAVKPLRTLPQAIKVAPLRWAIERLTLKHLDLSAARPVDWLLGAAMFVRREAMDTVGGFDPRYFLYLEDCDWCRSFWERGWEIHYVPHIELVHAYQRREHRLSSFPLWRFFQSTTARAHTKAWIQYLWKWRGRHRTYANT